MKRPIIPQLFLLSCIAGWLNREQQRVLEYMREENRVLREQLGPKPPRLNDDQRRRLAVRGKLIGRKLLGDCASIVRRHSARPNPVRQTGHEISSVRGKTS